MFRRSGRVSLYSFLGGLGGQRSFRLLSPAVMWGKAGRGSRFRLLVIFCHVSGFEGSLLLVVGGDFIVWKYLYAELVFWGMAGREEAVGGGEG